MMDVRGNQVLLVGDNAARLELDLIPYGLTCQWVDSAAAAVQELKGAAWPMVVVAEGLPDMTGPAFIDGLLKHFSPSSVVLLSDVDGAQQQALTAEPRVRIFGGSTDGTVVADHLFRAAGGQPRGPTAAPPPPPDDIGGLNDIDEMLPSNIPHSGTPPPMFAPPSTPGGIAPPGSLGDIFDAAPRTAGTAAQATPAQAFSMPPPTNSGLNIPGGANGAASWPPQPKGRVNSTMPFFQAFGGNGGNGGPGAASNGQSPPPHTQSPAGYGGTGPDRATMDRVTAMAEELAGANAEVVTLRARLQASEQRGGDAAVRRVQLERSLEEAQADIAILNAQLEGARQAPVTEVMALSEESDGLENELQGLRSHVEVQSIELEGATNQLQMVREERDRLANEVMSLRQADQDRAIELDSLRAQVLENHADLEQFKAAAETAERAFADLDARFSEAAGAAEELAALRALTAEKDVERARLQSTNDEFRQQNVALAEELQAAKAELENLGASKRDVEAAWSIEQQRVEELEQQHAEEMAKAADAQEALTALRAKVETAEAALREAKEYAALEKARADRAVGDASGMRTFIEQQTHEQARVVGELETLRLKAAGEQRAPESQEAIDEAVRTRTRELFELAQAIEPFTWGLTQATTFFKDQEVEGSTRHLQAMNLLQKTLERLKNELDRFHER